MQYNTRAIDKDKLSMVPRDKAAHSALMALHQLQDIEHPEHMLLGVATLFSAFCNRCGIDPSEVHAMGLSVIKARDDGDAPTGGAIQVLRDFAGIRLMGQDVSVS
jgi:hypothetical protein